MKFSDKKRFFFGLTVLLSALVPMMTIMSGCSMNFGFSEVDGESDSKTSQSRTLDTTSAQDATTSNAGTEYGYENISDEKAKEIYTSVDQAVQSAYEPKFECEVGLSEKQIMEGISAYKYDHPEVFWLKTYYYYSFDDSKAYISLGYTVQGEELENAKAEFEQKVQSIVDGAPQNASDYERELYANNYIVENCEYDYEAAQVSETVGNESSAYGALVDGKAVCGGYSYALQLLCNRLDIDCVCVFGKVNEGHQWNCVKLDGDWYQVDVTWNDSESEISRNDYLNLTDSQMYSDHKLYGFFKDVTDESYENSEIQIYNFYVPECTCTEYNYYRQSGVVISDINDDNEVEDALAQAARNGEEYFSVVIEDNLDFDAATAELTEGGVFSSWIISANEANGNSPELKTTIRVYYKENIRVITADLEYN